MTPATILHYPVRATENDLQLELLAQNSCSRPQVERFIHEVFAHAYGARVQHFLPALLSLQSSEKRVLAALGMRTASDGTLFLENYFDIPVEEKLRQVTGHAAARTHIIELGNLASVHRGGLRLLIIALTAYLKGAGAEWVVFTAVPVVLRAFAALNLNLYPLGPADRSRLGKEQEQWGSYYDHSPVVVAGKVNEGFECLQAAIQADTLLRFNACLWQHAWNVGQRQRLEREQCLPAMQVSSTRWS